MRQLDVSVGNDHLDKVARTRDPVSALAEIIWNSLDANANKVEVFFEYDALDELTGIEVHDNGDGLPYEKLDETFSFLGQSWKKNAGVSPGEKRFLHGKEGQGRFKALALGRFADWNFTYYDLADEGKLKTCTASIHVERMSKCDVTEPQLAPTSLTKGTKVIIGELHRNFRSLTSDEALNKLSNIFALYLRLYQKVEIFVNGTKLSPNANIKTTKIFDLAPVDKEGQEVKATLEIIEWKRPTERTLYLCNTNGFPLEDEKAGIQAPGFSFTAYIKSDYFGSIAEIGTGLMAMDRTAAVIIDLARQCLKTYFIERAKAETSDVVKRWQEARVYPYAPEPASQAENAERQIFDVVALHVNKHVPGFEEQDAKAKKLSFALLRNAIEHGAHDLRKILEEVLGLPPEKRNELVALLEKTSFDKIIEATNFAIGRLDCLKGLEKLIFEEAYKDKFLERTQLHKLMADNTWIFGEHFSLAVNEGGLTTVLRKHRKMLGEGIKIEEPLVRNDGSAGRVDIMLARSIPTIRSDEHEHLVIELKRANFELTLTETSQLRSYAFKVAEDPRFDTAKTKWNFVIIAASYNDDVKRETRTANLPRGVIYQAEDKSITVVVKTWAEIINEARSRLQLYKDKLEYEASDESALEYLRKTHSKYLGNLLDGDIDVNDVNAAEAANEGAEEGKNGELPTAENPSPAVIPA